jgi:hypothetical protein
MEMFFGTDLGAAFLEALDDLVNSAMPPEAVAGSGGAHSWMPSFTSMSQFNSSVLATSSLIAASTKEGSLGGMGATNISTLDTLGMVLRKQWSNASGTKVVGGRRRGLAAPQQQRMLATTSTICVVPSKNESHDVTAITVTFMPPASLVAALGLNDPSEIATLINEAITSYSTSMTVFTKLLANCTGSNLTVVLSAGKIKFVTSSALNTVVPPSTGSNLLPYAYGFGGSAAGCCVCAAVIFFCRRRRRPRKLLVLFDNNAAGGRLASAAARALVAETSFSGSSLYGWRIDMAPLLCDDDAILKPDVSDNVSALRAAADAIIVILAPNDKQKVSCSPLMCTVMVAGGTEAHCMNSPSDARSARDTPKEAAHLVCATLLPQDAEAALVRLSLSNSGNNSKWQATPVDSNALHKWVECVFTDAIVKLVSPTSSFFDSADWRHDISNGHKGLTLIVELMPPPIRTLIFVSDSPLTIGSDTTRSTTADSIFNALTDETDDGGILAGWNVIASPLMLPPATRDAAVRARADADLVIFYITGGGDTFVKDILGTKARVPQPVRLRPLSNASLGAINAAALLEKDAALLSETPLAPLRVASMSSLNKAGVLQSWAANYLAPIIPPSGQRAVFLATIAPSLLLLHVPGTPHGPARAVARALRYEAVTVGGSLVRWYVRSLAAVDASAVDRAAADVIIFLVEHKDALQAAASERMTLHSIEGMNARRLTDDIKTDDMNATAFARDQPFSTLLGTAVLLTSEDNGDSLDGDRVSAHDRAWVKTHIIPRLPRVRVGQSLTLIADFSALPSAAPSTANDVVIRLPPNLPVVLAKPSTSRSPPKSQSPPPTKPPQVPIKMPWGLSMWKPRNREKGRFPREDAHVIALVSSRRPTSATPAPGQLSWGGAASPAALDATGAMTPHPLRTRSKRNNVTRTRRDSSSFPHLSEINSDAYKLSRLYADNLNGEVGVEVRPVSRAPVSAESKQRIFREVSL